MQREQDYEELRRELAYAETGLIEIESRLKSLAGETSRIVDQLQQISYMKTQIKAGNPVEYMVPKGVSDAMAKTSKAVSFSVPI